MVSLKRRLLVIAAGAAIASAALPGAVFADTTLHVCTWHAQVVGSAVGRISAAPDAVLGPNNGGLPGGDKGPYPISFSTSDDLGMTTASANSSCA